MASPVLQSFCCANSNSFAFYGNSSETVRLSADDAAFLWYNVICVLTSTAGVCGCVCQLAKRTPRCFGCVTTPGSALLLLVQNNIIGCLAAADLLAVVGTYHVQTCRYDVSSVQWRKIRHFTFGNYRFGRLDRIQDIIPLDRIPLDKFPRQNLHWAESTP